MASLDRLLRPKSLAVIGGGTWCENVIRECRKIGFTGALWAVHPTRSDVADCLAFRTVSDLPHAPDAAFIGVNRHLTVDIVGELSHRGTGGAVCFASGFKEAAGELEDSHTLQDALVEAAGQMPIFGPNCYGFLNALDGAALWPDQHGLSTVSKGVAIISQSSNIALNMTMQTRGLPIAYLMTVGNQAQTGLSDIGAALLEDDRVTAIGLHIEGIDDLVAFEAFAMAAQRNGKPVVALKIGRSAQARSATISHTASLVGSSTGASALFARLGIAEVSDLTVLLETLKLLHVTGPLKSLEIASLSCSGGEASLIADLAEGRSITFPALTPKQQHDLREILGPKVALANPLDYHTYIWTDVAAMSQTFAAMMAGPAALGVVILDIPRQDRCDAAAWFKTIEAIKQARALSGKPFAVLSSLSEGLPEALATDLIENGIAPLCGIREAMEAIEAASVLSKGAVDTHLAKPQPVDDPRVLTESQAKEALRHFGLRIPRSAPAATPQCAADAAAQIGFPIAVKGIGIAHKTEAGAVALNLMSAEAVADAAANMPASGFLVEEMVTDVVAELLVGVLLDPAHGYVVTLAAGGILTELMQDSVSLLLPVSRADIQGALAQLAYARVLNGYRGAPGCDLDAIADAIMAVQAYTLSAPVAEVEINPLLCGTDFAIAADALITCGDRDDR